MQCLGAPLTLPDDRVMDGKSILSLLKGHHTSGSPHQFMFHYCGTEIHAVRYIPNPGKNHFLDIQVFIEKNIKKKFFFTV